MKNVLKQPLYVSTDNDHIYIVANKKVYHVKSPFYNTVIYEDPKGKYLIKDVTDNIRVNVKRFRNEKDARTLYLSLKNIPRYFYPAHIELAISKPEFYERFPQEIPLDIMYLDIEIALSGAKRNMDPNRDPILLIGYAINDSEVNVLRGNVDDFDNMDREMIKEFLRIVRERDVDVIVSYSTFDMKYIIERARKFNIPDELFARFSTVFVGTMKWNTRVIIPGRIYYDLLDKVWRDQSLTGKVTDRKLKTVAKFLGFEDIKDLSQAEKENMVQTYLNDPEKVIEYNKSDVEVIRKLLPFYFDIDVWLANYLRLPLSIVAQNNKSYLYTLMAARHSRKRKMFFISDNSIRYKGYLKEERKFRYEGAFVKAYKTGLIENVSKADVASMYPTLMVISNVGPDTTRLIEELPYKDEYKFFRTKNKLILTIPDSKIKDGVSLKIEIDQTKDSFIREIVYELMKERLRVKKLKKEKKSKLLEIKNIGLKVLINSVYGSLGEVNERYGDLMSAIVVTSLGRWLIKKAIDYFGDRVIEVDTDGILLEGDFDVDKLNAYIREELKKVGFDPRYVKLLTFEKERYLKGFFHRKKNYILLTPEGEYVVHGVAFKGSHKSKLHKKLMDSILDLMFHHGMETLEEKIPELTDLSNYKWPDDFVMRVHINKEKDEYKSTSCLTYNLSKQYEKIYGEWPTIGDFIDYIVIKDPDNKYLMLERFDPEIHEMDEFYYKTVVYKILSLFNLENLMEKPTKRRRKKNEQT